MSPLFLDHAQTIDLAERLEHARVAVRHARRYTTKAESRAGQAANASLHEAEKVLDTALAMLR